MRAVLVLSLVCLTVGAASGQTLRERVSSLAASPAAAAYEKAAAAPAPATTAAVPGEGFYAAAPAPGQLLMEKGKLGAGAVAGDNVYQIIKAQADAGKEFTTLAALVDKAGLAGALSDPNAAITVLAPTNAAFTAFAGPGKSAADFLADAKPEVIKAILLQHVVTEAKKVSDLKAGESLGTKGTAGVRVAAVDPVKIAVIGGPGGDSTVETGVSTANGKGHVIAVNRVLLPPQAALEAAA